MFDCDGRDFNFGAADQAGNLDRGSRRFGVGDEGFVDLVHLGDIVEAGNKDSYIDEIGHLEAGSVDDLLDGGDGAGSFLAISPDNFPCTSRPCCPAT